MSVPSGKIERHTIQSRYLGEERRFWVYYPAHYDPDRSYPVLYAHDGEDYLNMGRIRTIVNEQTGKGNLVPIVMVGLPVAKAHRNAEYDPEGERHQAYLNLIVKELIPFVEQQHGLGILAKERATIGSSLGAVVSCQLAWNYPGLFQAVISQSGAFYSTATTAALEQMTEHPNTRYYVMVGTDETEVPTSVGIVNLLDANRRFRDLLRDKGIPFYYEEQKGGHTWGLWQQNLPDGLAYFWATK